MISRHCYYSITLHRSRATRRNLQSRLKSDLSQSTMMLVEILLDHSQSIYKRRSALAKAITLAESSHPEHMLQADLLMQHLSDFTYGQEDTTVDKIHKKRRSFRIGITGSPGVGKSSFIDTLGKLLLTNQVVAESLDRNDLFSPSSVAVLCVDPSSTISGGSILGDKARMEFLSNCDKAFIRPSPSKGSLGGLSTYTNDTIALCEASGYDLIVVESVGVGQSEIEISHCVDIIVLLVPPGGGDSLQGIKKGIVEICDLIVVTKADGDLLKVAMSTASEYTGALNITRANYGTEIPRVITASSKSVDGVVEVWKHICQFRNLLTERGDISKRRKVNAVYWMWRHLKDMIEARTRSDENLKKQALIIEKRLFSETLPPRVAARMLYDSIITHKSG